MVTFVLKNAKATVETLIYLTYYFNARRFKLSTGQHLNPTHWNKVKHRARKEAPGAVTLNKYLDRLAAKVKEIHLRLISDFGRITPDTLRMEVQRELDRGNSTKETFVTFIERVIRETKKKKGTVQIYRSVLKLLKGFPGNKDFNDIDVAWMGTYQAYMENARGKQNPNGYAANYIGKNIVYIKTLMGEAKRQGLTRNEAFRSRDYVKPGEDAYNIYLTNDELIDIYRLELPEGLNRVRNRFLIGAFSGLRFSDSALISMENIQEGLIFSDNIKTGNDVIIPIHWVIEEIMNSHPEGLPPSIQNQPTNRYLKLIAHRAGIEQKIVKTRTNGGVRTGKAFDKWELVTTHTARRSAATNMYIAGIPSISIMKITGHKTESSFMKYIKISKEENARLIQGHAYFQRPPEKDCTDKTESEGIIISPESGK